MANSGYSDQTLTKLEQRKKQFNVGKRVALIVGTGNYDSNKSGYNKLDFASSDAKKMYDLLKGAGDFDTIVLLNDETKEKPNSKTIKEKLKQLRAQNPHFLLFYYSGHGTRVESDEKGSLALPDVTKDNQNLVGISEINEITSGITQRLFLLDSCRNYDKTNPKPNKKKTPKNIPPFRIQKVEISLILSCRKLLEVQKVYLSYPLHHQGIKL